MLEQFLITVLLLLILIGIPGVVIMKIKNPYIIILTLVLFISSVITVVDYKAKTIAEHKTMRKN